MHQAKQKCTTLCFGSIINVGVARLSGRAAALSRPVATLTQNQPAKLSAGWFCYSITVLQFLLALGSPFFLRNKKC